jgi:translation initiation factor IF-2
MSKEITKQNIATTTIGVGTRVARPPIVVVMGHVDHGKTTLLDYIRKAAFEARTASEKTDTSLSATGPRSVAEREAGGITQATSAYEILHGGRKITFIDTPGHEAFKAMRSRGAQIADIAVLIVAADDGVKPQTKEVIQTLEETKTPFVVAFTKIDKTGDNFEKARNDLMATGVLLEGFGGQVSFQGVSGKTGEGVDGLLDLLLLSADMENLSYDPVAPASGFILEARRDPRRGIEATVIVKDGTLRRGEDIKTQSASGKVKILEDFTGKTVLELEPSAPAVVSGWEILPQVGEEFTCDILKFGDFDILGAASKSQNAEISKYSSRHLNLILKASDAGSLEALSVVLQSIEGAHANGLRILDSSVGDITDGDVSQAIATGAIIIGFKNRIEKASEVLADAHRVRIIMSKIVYDLEKAVEDFLAEESSTIAGELEVIAVFNQEKTNKQLVGGRVTAGVFKPKAVVEILRLAGVEEPTKPLGTGRILTLRENKSEIFTAEKGKEIGVVVNTSVLIQIGDRIVIKK